jgi:hypothetical protein
VQDELFAASAAVGESPGNAELAQASGQPEGNFITYIYIYIYIYIYTCKGCMGSRAELAAFIATAPRLLCLRLFQDGID